MAFFQSPPQLGNQFDDDELLQEYLARRFDGDERNALRDTYRHLGALGRDCYYQQLEEREQEPTLTHWDAWGHRVDNIEVSRLWQRAQRIAAEQGLVAAGYEPTYGDRCRIDQFVRNYLVQASLDVYSCPLAMTDGAASTLVRAENQELIRAVVPKLTSRDPQTMWTSGQWMTERRGGSDVSQTETEARLDGDQWRLYGTKWFTSASTSQVALALARPQGNPAGSRGLALFFVELRDEHGRLRGISINRLKDKLGTRKVPTAELTLEGTPAIPVAGLGGGVRRIAPMLSVTRTWNAMACAWFTRRLVALSRDYARKRHAFGGPLSEKPLHIDTLSGFAAETEGVFHLAFRAAELLGRGDHDPSEHEQQLLRLLTPIAKLTTGKQAAAIASEAIESFGGAGYVEDTGLPRILADIQVLPIWEGTTDVLSLDFVRSLAGAGLAPLRQEVIRAVSAVEHPELARISAAAVTAVDNAAAWLAQAQSDQSYLESGARRLALTIGRALELALLCEHAQAISKGGKGQRAFAAAVRFQANGIDQIDNAAASWELLKPLVDAT